ncbi:GAF domain-containing protein, partial [Pseudophaeobacter sp.]
MQQLASPVNEWKNQGSSDELLVLSSSTGRDFIQFFAETLADCFEIDLVTIGELLVMENERISVLAGSMDGKPLEDFDYQACLTPCIAVIQTAQPIILLSDVQKSYTEDNLLREQGIRSYIGIPLKNSEGELIGVVQASWRREIDPEEAEHVLETIDMFVARLSAELVTLHAMRILAALAEGPSLIGNLDTLRLLTEQMQTALKVRVAFIAETLPEDDHSFRLLTYCQDGKLIPDVENEIVPYAGTP